GKIVTWTGGCSADAMCPISGVGVAAVWPSGRVDARPRAARGCLCYVSERPRRCRASNLSLLHQSSEQTFAPRSSKLKIEAGEAVRLYLLFGQEGQRRSKVGRRGRAASYRGSLGRSRYCCQPFRALAARIRRTDFQKNMNREQIRDY